MQTGNTIFLALGAASLPRSVPLMWLKALYSVLAFLLGVLFFSQTRSVQPRAKRTLASSFLAQALLIWTAAALAQGCAAPAFQFGGQIVTTRLLGFN